MTRITPLALLLAQLTLAAGAGAAGTIGTSEASGASAELGGEEPSSLDDFEILQYVAARNYPPSVSIALDNNGQILLACRQGRSVEELRESGLEFAESQIELLIAMKLMIRDSRGDLYTAFPILDEAQTLALRGETFSLAEELSAVVGPDVEALSRALEAAGQGAYGYSVLFSYVLDGMVWGFFEEYRRVPMRALSVRRPFWSGEVWAVRPGREFRAGTQSINQKGLKLKVNLSAGFGEAGELFADPGVLRQGLAQFEATGRLAEGTPRQLLTRFGLVDETGLWVIPVIDEIKKGPVFRAAEVLTSNLVDAILERIDLVGLQERYGFRSAQQALVIVYHELMVDLIERFERAGWVTRPEILSQPAKAGGSAVAAVAFLVDRRPPNQKRLDDDAAQLLRDSLEERAMQDDG